MAEEYKGHPSLEKYVSLLAQRETGIVALEVLVCVVLLLAALLGNSLVLWMVCKNKNLRTIPNHFIISLALSDIAMATICQPPCLTVLIVGKRTYFLGLRYPKRLTGSVPLCPIMALALNDE